MSALNRSFCKSWQPNDSSFLWNFDWRRKLVQHKFLSQSVAISFSIIHIVLPHNFKHILIIAFHDTVCDFFLILQQRKTPTSGQQQFYPIPPKAVLPNHPTRSFDHIINPRTANALRNIERAQWQTTYNKNFTGYGPANALRLDNFDEKLEKEQRAGIEDHGLVGVSKQEKNRLNFLVSVYISPSRLLLN